MYSLDDFNNKWVQHVSTNGRAHFPNHFDNFSNFSIQHASRSCRTLAPTNSPYIFNPHEPCSYYSNPYHHVRNCPFIGEFSNFSYEQMSTNYSIPGFE
jgi:hypothetical protein